MDGRTAGDNTQASWVGMGFDVEPGYVQRTYQACADDGHGTWGDLCWGAGENLTLSLGGRSGVLQRLSGVDGADSEWRLRDDPGWRIRKRTTGVSNGDDNNEWIEVTDADGTRYLFGRGAEGGSGAATNATWTVPVFGDDAGEPCAQAGSANGQCRQAWRWNLEQVIDAHDTRTTFFYAKESNSYGQQGYPSRVAAYDRGGVLTKVEWGKRPHAGGLTQPTAKLGFVTVDRCLSEAGGSGAGCGNPTGSPGQYPDVPTDLICTSGSGCYGSGKLSPSFFTTKMLRRVTSYVNSGDVTTATGSWQQVDRLNFTYRFPDPDGGGPEDPSLWLDSVQRVTVGSPDQAMPPITFDSRSTLLANRADANPSAGAVPMLFWRVDDIGEELGGHTRVTYGQPDPCPTPKPSSASNTALCFPRWWKPSNSPAGFAWFNKYVTTQVTDEPRVGGTTATVTRYSYDDDPAWRYDDAPTVPAARRAWSDYRGYGRVTVTEGPAAASPTVTRHLLYRGMDGDRTASGGTKNVTLTDSRGDSVPDSAWLAGQSREVGSYGASGTSLREATFTSYWTAVTVGHPDPSKAARYVRPRTEKTRTLLDGGRGWRETAATSDYSGEYGDVLSVEETGDLAVAGDERCTRSDYATNMFTTNPAVWLRLEDRTTVRDGTCGDTGAPLAAYSETLFDGATTPGGTPARGDATTSRTWTGPTATGAITTRATFDVYGRPTSDTDPNGRTSTTAYTPALGKPASVRTTDPKGWTSTTELEPRRGLPVRATDVNGRVTRQEYDLFGRLVAAYTPLETGSTAAWRFDYAIDSAGQTPPVVTTRQRQTGTGIDSEWIPSAAVLDGLGRTVETQTSSSAGGRVVAATRYDDRGLVVAQTDGLHDPKAGPGAGLLNPDPTKITRESRTVYDALERPVAEQLWATTGTAMADQNRTTTTAYTGDGTFLTPPVGAPTFEHVDGLDRTDRVEERDPAGTHTTRYGYTARDELSRITDAEGNVTTYTYDLSGRRTAASDPDAGTSTTTYDAAGNITATTDGTGQRISTTYDELDRPTSRWAGPPTTGTRLAAWTYDTLPNAKGQPVTTTSYDDGHAWTSRVTGYDDRYRPTGTTITVPAAEGLLAGSYTYSQTHNAADALISATLPAAGGLPAEMLTTRYQPLTGLPQMLTGAPAGSPQVPYVTATGYAGDNTITSRSFGGAGLRRDYAWNHATGELVGLQARTVPTSGPTTLVQDDTYIYAADGAVTAVRDGLAGVAQCYGHDPLRRLTRAYTTTAASCTGSPATTVQGAYDHRYTYSPTGNLTSQRDGTRPARTYTYGAGAAGPHSVTATTNGRNYTYDTAGRMTRRSTVGGPTTSYTWTPEGRLAQVATTDGATTSTQTDVYDPAGQRLARRDGDTTTVYLPGLELTAQAGTVTARRYYTAGGTTVAQRTTADGVTYLLGDAQGSATLAVSAGGQVARQQYLPFGAQRGPTGQLPGDRGWLGQTRDDGTGLVYLNARYYDPDLARFLSPDPLLVPGQPQSVNAYTYALNNPTTYTDPSGLIAIGGSGRPTGKDTALHNARRGAAKSYGTSKYKKSVKRRYSRTVAKTKRNYSVYKRHHRARRHHSVRPARHVVRHRPQRRSTPAPWGGSRPARSRAQNAAVDFGSGAGLALGHTADFVLGAVAPHGMPTPDVATWGADRLNDHFGGSRTSAAGMAGYGLASVGLAFAGGGVGAAGRGAGALKSAPVSSLRRSPEALKSDVYHRSTSFVVDDPAAIYSPVRGGDGVNRWVGQVPGGVNGKSGVFEWMVDFSGREGVVTHQTFIPGAKVSGVPNMWAQ